MYSTVRLPGRQLGLRRCLESLLMGQKDGQKVNLRLLLATSYGLIDNPSNEGLHSRKITIFQFVVIISIPGESEFSKEFVKIKSLDKLVVAIFGDQTGFIVNYYWVLDRGYG
jgi:hypothetical protein